MLTILLEATLFSAFDYWVTTTKIIWTLIYPTILESEYILL